MPLYHLILIALIQGITEFLPVSSSGHLILLPGLTGLPDQGPVIDVAAHVGTLFAVIVYFWSMYATLRTASRRFCAASLRAPQPICSSYLVWPRCLSWGSA